MKMLRQRLDWVAKARWPGLVLLGLAFSVGCAFTGNEGPRAMPDQGERAGGVEPPADQYVVVDCVLPGQIRRLGTQVTYVTARRPMRTTAEDCAIRGGEYVAADRADYSEALEVWLEQAQDGDPQAQYYAGTLYEKGPKGQANYELAAIWYRKAAEQGFGRAAINLGRLYEQGLGVARDAGEAFKWYARATGLDQSGLSMLMGADAAARIDALEQTIAQRDSEIRKLRTNLTEVSQQLDQLRRQLDERTSQAQEGRRQLARMLAEQERLETQLQASRAKPQAKVEAEAYQEQLETLTNELRLKERKVEEQERGILVLEQTIALLEQDAGRMEALERDLAKREGEVVALSRELDQVNTELVQVRRQLYDRTNQAAEERRRLDEMEAQYRSVLADLEQARSRADRQSEIAQRERELRRIQDDLAARQQQVTQKDAQIARLQERVAELEQEAARRSAEMEVASTADLGLAGPTIEIIDPPIVATRGVRVEQRRIPVHAPMGTRYSITGRVLAPAGLRAVTVNGQSTGVDEQGMFTVAVSVLASDATGMPLDILAIDTQGKRAVMQLLISARGPVREVGHGAPGDAHGFGTYHALVIGNDHYRHWEPLKNAVADASAVTEVLRGRYGFEVTLLKDATRTDVLRALNYYRKTLTEKDNLLIYYAGHGYLEPGIDRGYWIPVEAELDDNSNWILLPTITDLLQLMAAKHVMVVADSCFAGKLTRTSLAKLQPGLSKEARLRLLKKLAHNRVRTALTAGGVRPVLDEGGEGHSVFAEAFLGVLKENNSILEAERLFWAVRARVMRTADRLDLEQIPTYSPIQFAGHESLGDFIFVPGSA